MPAAKVLGMRLLLFWVCVSSTCLLHEYVTCVHRHKVRQGYAQRILLLCPLYPERIPSARTNTFEGKYCCNTRLSGMNPVSSPNSRDARLRKDQSARFRRNCLARPMRCESPHQGVHDVHFLAHTCRR
eukprot:4346082-Pleurochrysis_carterae.AAC.3